MNSSRGPVLSHLLPQFVYAKPARGFPYIKISIGDNTWIADERCLETMGFGTFVYFSAKKKIVPGVRGSAFWVILSPEGV